MSVGRLFGWLVLIAGTITLFVSFRAHEWGLGKYEGVGLDQFKLTGVAVLVQFVGILLIASGKGRSRRRR